MSKGVDDTEGVMDKRLWLPEKMMNITKPDLS